MAGITPAKSEVPKRGRSKRGQTQKHANVRKREREQMHAKERKHKSAKERKKKKAPLRKNCKQPGLKQSGLGTLNKTTVCQKHRFRHPPKSNI